MDAAGADRADGPAVEPVAGRAAGAAARPPLLIAVDSPHAPDVQRLIERHLSGMLEFSPPESVHALAAEALAEESVTLWSARIDGRLAGLAALRTMAGEPDGPHGEIKSMRVADAFLRLGVGRALLQHLMAEARERGMTRLWLETGSTPDFAAARVLYAREGFDECGPFGSYAPDPFSVFMTRSLDDPVHPTTGECGERPSALR